jgi:hypothetical protein
MLKKLLIPMGLVSALGASTAMAVNLDGLTAATKGTAVIATDSLLTTAFTAGSGANLGKKYYRVVNSGNNMDISGTIGVGFAIGDQLWIRYDITGGAWDGALTASMATVVSAGMDAIAQGGQDGASSVVFSHTVAGTNFAQTDSLKLDVTNLGWDGSSALGVTVATYEKLSDATNQTNSITSKAGTVLVGATGVRVTAAPANETAEVQVLFTAFNATGTDVTADLGNLTVDPSTAATVSPTGAVDALDGAAFLVADAVTIGATTSLTTITGDFSFGTWSVSADNCATATTTFKVASGNLNAGLTTATGVSNDYAGTGSLCMTATGKETIPVAGPYTASMVLTAVAARANAQAAIASSFGSILHNGTTVQLPYLTTFADYNQRLVIVNRGTSDATYSVTFTSEATATATAGTAATGTVAAGTTSSIKVSDIVTMTGLTRTAATIVIVAPTANLSVATNQVNLSDGSTDTVVLL